MPHDNRPKAESEAMSHGILLVVGDEEVQRHVYETKGCAYWSAQFGLVLEKNGLLDFEVADQDALHRADYLRRFPIVIVAWLPEEFWRESYVDTLKGYEGLLVLEGPPPDALLPNLGLRAEAGSPSLKGEIEVIEPLLAKFLTEQYRPFLTDGRIAIAPKNIRTRPVRPNRWDSGGNPSSSDFDDLARRVVKSFRIPFWKRTLDGTGFPKVRDELLSLYFLIWDRAKGGEAPPEGPQAILDRLDSFEAELDRPSDRAIAQEIRRFLGAPTSTATPTGRRERSRPIWRHLAGLLPGLLQRPAVDSDELLEMLITLPLGQAPRDLPAHTADALRAQVEGTLAFDKENVVPRRRLTLAEAALCSLVFTVLGETSKAERALHLCLEAGFDMESGRFNNVLLGPKGHEPLPHHTLSPFLALAFLAVLDNSREPPFVGLSFRDRYGAERVDRWHAAPHRLQRYHVTDGEMVATLHGDAEGPAVVRKGKRLCFTFEALSYIVYYHTMHPLDGPFTDCDASGAMALEALFLTLLHQQAAQLGVGMIKLEPWPWGHDYCLTLRHDVDRIPDETTHEALLSVETEAGLGVSWFWLPNRLRPDLIARQEAAGHEIALHALKHEDKERELAAVTTCLTRQQRICGEFIHGGGGGEYWLGHPSVEAARKAGLTYGEGMSTYYDYPYRFPFLAADGRVCIEPLISLSHSMSLDLAAPEGGGDTWPWPQHRVEAALHNGFYLMVLNHPDKHLNRLRQLLSELPAQGRLNWTCKQVAEWWHATHRRDGLSLARDGQSADARVYVVQADQDVEDLALRLVGMEAREAHMDDGTGGRPLEVRSAPGLVGGRDTLVRVALRKDHLSRLEIGLPGELQPAAPSL